MWDALATNLPHLNAALNTVATCCSRMGLWNIKNGRAKKPKKPDAQRVGVSVVFLACYLIP